MAGDEALWNLERRFWVEGATFYEDRLAVEALMVFPAPVGILGRQGVIEAMQDGPRWQQVRIHDGRLRRVEGTIALAYRAVAQRGDESYHALCGSVHVRTDEGYRLIYHQQTPAG